MTNFKIGQKVMCIKGVVGFLIKGNTYTITNCVLCSCGTLEVSWGQHCSFMPPQLNCASCGKDLHNSNSEYYCRAHIYFRPISYSSNTNFEIIANFSPLEEKSDVPVTKPEKAITNTTQP